MAKSKHRKELEKHYKLVLLRDKLAGDIKVLGDKKLDISTKIKSLAQQLHQIEQDIFNSIRKTKW